MSTENDSPRLPRLGIFRNWLSLSGLVIVLGSLFAFILLSLIDSLAHVSNPYIGILTYLVSPVFLFFGLALAVLGVILRRRKARKAGLIPGTLPSFQVDLARPRDRKLLGWFLVASTLFLLTTAVLSYHTYHYSESVQFCGQACHTVMQPELVTYQHSPHARVACTECHIGPGAAWYVRSKLSGTYQVYATLAHKFPRPIPTPIKNLRPAQETCEQCHWPKKFIGNLDRTYSYFLGDETNSPYTIRMSMKVGGGDPTHGPVGGIHWHMNVGNRVQYIASDEARQKIPWVRLIDPEGVVTEFRSPGFTNDVSKYSVRTMDCIECHNRPSHNFETPNAAVDLALNLKQIDAGLPWIKTNSVFVLTKRYANEIEALQTIATTLANRYPESPRLRETIKAVQQIYQDNFFPQMKADWKAYPDNIGHKDWPGCFRCPPPLKLFI